MSDYEGERESEWMEVVVIYGDAVLFVLYGKIMCE